MNTITEFLGHPVSYWITLQRKAEQLNYVDLITEIANLHAKVGFYEARISDMNLFMRTRAAAEMVRG